VDKKLRILILEDVPTDAELIERELQKAEVAFTSRWVDNRDTFLKELEDFSPNIVLSDYSMPHFNGIEALELVKERFPSIPLIIVTGSMNEETAVECLKNGAADYVIKENMTRLGQAVDGAIQKQRIKQEKEWAIEALKESEERYKTLFQDAPEGILIANIKTKKFLHANPAFCELLGYTEEELIQLDISNIHPKEDLDHMLHEFEAQAQGEKTLAQNIPCLRKDGTTIYTDIVTAPILIGGKNCNLGFFRDITERKKLEAQFVQAQKMEAIGTLTGGIAHDFNNLLTAIIGNSELALMDINKDNRLYEYIEEIKNAGEHAASLISQLLAFSRKQVIKPGDLDFNQEINQMGKMIWRLIGEDIEFLTVLEPELWKVHMDPGQMSQVIMNLLVNSRSAMPRGGKITIETANVDLDSGFFHDHGVEEQPGPYVMLAVSDTGIGMNKETQSRIFEPFFTTKERSNGTGLGLSTVYGTVKQNSGYIWVNSELGRGTTFKIYLPKVKKDAELEEKERTVTKDFKGSETVLIVEDDDGLRHLAKKILQQYGYRVLEAQDGEEALKVCEDHEGPIHLLLTDVVMPGKSGREVAENLQPLRPDTKVIYMSGYLDDTITLHGILAPGMNFLEKPFSPKGLARKVREGLDRGIEE